MTFAYPTLLLLLAVPFALAAWEILRRGRRVPLPLDHGATPHRRWLHGLVVSANVLPSLLLACAIVLLARPQRIATPQAERVQTSIEFCLDVSGSMMVEFGTSTAFDSAMAAISDFTTQRAGDAFGLTMFGNEALRWVPGTKDLAVIRQSIPWLRPDKLPRHFGGTQIAKALRTCLATMDQLAAQNSTSEATSEAKSAAKGDRMVILVSDGQSQDVNQETIPELSHAFRSRGITLFMIYIGYGQPQNELQAICSASGGGAFGVTDPQALKAVFAHIDRMKPVTFSATAETRVDHLRPFALTGLALLALFGLTALKLRFTPW